MKKSYLALLLMLGLVFFASSTSFAAIYADSLVNSQYVTQFGSGSVTGAPDGGGLWLGDTSDPPANPGYITVGFSGGLTDGPGYDLFVVDIANSAVETANIYVSLDNIAFTLIGMLNAVNNQIDINGSFSNPIYYVKIANASTSLSIDIDTVGGYYPASVPEPTTMLLLGFGLIGLAGLRRK